MALPRALDKLLPPKTEHDPAHDPVAFHPQYQYHPNQPMLDQAMLIAVHSVDGVKHPVHDMGFYYSRGVLRQASDLFYQYLEDPTTGPQRLEETPARVLLLLRFLDIGTGKTSIQDFHLTIAEVWDLFHMLDRYAVKGYYRTLFKTILHDPNSILDITGQVSHMRPMIDWSILALGMPPEERAALVFKLRMVAHELRLGMLWNRLRLYTTSKIEVPEIVRQELLPEYLDVVVRVLTVLKVASRLQLHYDTDLVLVGYSDAYAYKMYLSIGNGEVVHRF